eukprot:813339_1
MERSKKMLMTPFEINEYNIHPIRISNGIYSPIQPQQYELPCMPNEIFELNDSKMIEQRIDPSILTQIYNPFGEQLKPSTSRHIKSNYSRQDSIIIHDRNISNMSNSSQSMSILSHTSSPSNSVSLPQSTSSVFFSPHDNQNTASKLFSRTNRAQTHNGGLPRLLSDNKQQSYSKSDEYDNNSIQQQQQQTQTQAPNKIPPRKNIDINISKPPLPLRKSPKNSPRNSPNKPNLPPRKPPPSIKKSLTPTPNYNNNNNKAPQLPPRRKTLPHNNNSNVNNFKRPPKKNPIIVAEKVRKTSSIVNGNGTNYNSDSNSNDGHGNKKKKK